MRISFILRFILFINLTIFSLSKIEIKISSSENGYTIIPDKISISNFENPVQLINFQNKNGNCFSAELLPGTYILNIIKTGFSPCQTYFTIAENDIRYDIYLDPDSKDPLLKPERIKKLLHENSTLLLGYIVDDETGLPLNSVTVKNNKSLITASSDANGYFELYLPSECSPRTFVDLTFGKLGYAEETFPQFELFPGTDFIFTARLKRANSVILSGNDNLSKDNCEGCNSKKFVPGLPVSGFVLPLNIRVGRNCSGTNCTYAEVYSVETYCKYVLPAEIYACWGNLAGGMNSLEACAVAVRSYGIYYVYNPINPSLYDICDNTYCQYMGSVLSTNTNNAVDNTYRNILTNSSGVVRCEYSAENNNKGCGNGYSGTGSSWPCIYDPVCLNASPNGHGRGLCQWGTVRWATGTLVSVSSPCSQGAPHSFGILSWQQILNHYYNVSPYNWSVVLGITGSINSSACTPQASNPCSTITIASNVTVTNPVSLMAGASIALTGTSNWISDPDNDVKINFAQGTGNYNRQFVIPCTVQSGTYDLLTALWYDKDNNNHINQGDFVVSSKLTPAALVISPIGIKPISSEIPKQFKLYQNYPNPFNPVTKIRFDVPGTETNPRGVPARLVIYDISGKLVETLVSEELTPGIYEISLNGSAYSSGVYYYKLSAGSFSETKKMIVVK